MAYIFNKYILPRKTIKTALTGIYGIGPKKALEIANYLCINPNIRMYMLNAEDISKLTKYISTRFKVAGVLQKTLKININRKIKIRSYQGSRHKNKFPVRGQRTRTNAKTQKKMVRKF